MKFTQQPNESSPSLAIVTATMIICRPTIRRQEAGSTKPDEQFIHCRNEKNLSFWFCSKYFGRQAFHKAFRLQSVEHPFQRAPIWMCVGMRQTMRCRAKYGSIIILPNKFSPEIISNLMSLCSFTEKDKSDQNTNGMIFQKRRRFRNLSISFPSESIQYARSPSHHYGPTNLAEGVPRNEPTCRN